MHSDDAWFEDFGIAGKILADHVPLELRRHLVLAPQRIIVRAPSRQTGIHAILSLCDGIMPAGEVTDD